MAAKQNGRYKSVDASPVKSFFVSMLTRDIKLEEAILDLLDNCVDGILRGGRRKLGKKPYDGYWAKIEFSKSGFSISDNCGGIPWKLHEYAFRMGRSQDRPVDTPGTVGVYGIGMKRAIFKMGKQCRISTQHKGDRYEVQIKPDWIADETQWELPVKAASKKMPEDGTQISIGTLYPGVQSRLGDDSVAFRGELDRLVSTHYAFIINKGFRVEINRTPVSPRVTRLLYTAQLRGKKHPSISPFIFRTKIKDVEVFLAVGFTRPIPSPADIEDEQEERRYSSIDAGWTVVCNDRAVLYADRDELTGWGEAGVPRYHTQFIAISGIVEFRSSDASQLPTTTTKRGIDASSSIYLQVKHKMREGMRQFTDYTYKWKGMADESKKHMDQGRLLSFEEIKHEVASGGMRLRAVRQSALSGKQFKPSLPEPKKLESKRRRISFTKDAEDVEFLADFLFEDPETSPAEVGERCFDMIMEDALK